MCQWLFIAHEYTVEDGSNLVSQGPCPPHPNEMLAVRSPYSNKGASKAHQVTPCVSLETSNQRCRAIQLRLACGHWSFSISITPQGMSTFVTPCGTLKPKPKCMPSLSSNGNLSTTLVVSTHGCPATRRTVRVTERQPFIVDSTFNSTTKPPCSVTVTACTLSASGLFSLAGSQLHELAPPSTDASI